MGKPPVRDSLTTTSAEGKRIRIYPAEVSGRWSRRRSRVQWALILLYVALPWIRIGGHPLLQLDIEHRRFSIFGQLFFAQEVPDLVFLTLSFMLFIGLITSWFGRAWCGWACPQTVFIERVFRSVERLVEGNALNRKRLHEGSWSLGKILKKSIKWVAFTGIAVVLSHSFLGYFVGGEASFGMMTRSPALHPASFTWVLLFTGVVLFDFAWFREQFCLVACPYGRFQSVMMDDSSLFIHYDRTRKDCIDCSRCVSVCPTGIDIRNGLQMECIACTACVDACDLVMSRIKKPQGLISYQSLRSIAGKGGFRLLRARPVIYASMLAACLSVLACRLSTRSPWSVEVTRAVDTPYQVLKGQDGSDWVLNHFRVHLGNRGWYDYDPSVMIGEGDRDRAELVLPPGLLQAGALHLRSGESKDFDVFLKVRKGALNENTGGGLIALRTLWSPSKESRTELKVIGPGHDL